MGWIRKFFGRRSPRPDAPPWISPRFLAMAGGLLAIFLAYFLWANFVQDQGPVTAPPTLGATGQERDVLLECAADDLRVEDPGLGALPSATCDPDQQLAQWTADHPEADIVRVQALFDDDGRHSGYRVVYTEDGG